MSSSAETTEAEEARIRERYARRPSHDSRYSWFNQGQLFMVQERERRFLTLLRRSGRALLEGQTILEIGCGTGYWLREFIKWGARPEQLFGVDLLADRVSEARRLCPTSVRVECRSAAKLNFSDESFDLVFQSTVFTSIQDPELKRQIAVEINRVVKPNGLILWYDFYVNNPRNPDVRGVKKEEIRQLFPNCQIELHRITLAPPLVRLLAPYSWIACEFLGKIPWLCTHYLGVFRKLSKSGNTRSVPTARLHPDSTGDSQIDVGS